MLVAGDNHRIALLLRNHHGHDLFGQPPRRDRRGGPLLAAQRECVLVGARDLEVDGHILGGLRHRVDAVLRLHERVDEAPADGRVLDLCAARERGLGLAHDERRARHAFHAAGDHERGLAALDRARRDADSVHARPA